MEDRSTRTALSNVSSVTAGAGSISSSKYQKSSKQFIHTKPSRNDNSHFYTSLNNSSNGAIYRPETSPEQSLGLGHLRFDTYCSTREQRMVSEIKKTGNLGPGKYDFFDFSNRPKTVTVAGSTRSQGCFQGVARNDIPVDLNPIYHRERGPPPGTYDVPRIMGFEGYHGAEIGTAITSPFTATGGRKNPLAYDAERYISKIQESALRNMGPGYYDLPDKWAPGSFQKYNKKYKHDTKSRTRSGHYEKPWADPPSSSQGTSRLGRQPVAPTGRRAQTPGVFVDGAETDSGSRGGVTDVLGPDEGFGSSNSSMSITSTSSGGTSQESQEMDKESVKPVKQRNITGKKKKSQRPSEGTSELAIEIATIRSLPNYKHH